MSGEEAPSKQCITGSMAAEEEVTGQEGHLLKPCTPKRKPCTDATAPAWGGTSEEEQAPEEKMTRLPQEEVDWILAREFRAPSDFEALRRSNPDLTPPPDEEMDEPTKLFYDAARIFYDGQEGFFKFQEEVRQKTVLGPRFMLAAPGGGLSLGYLLFGGN
ncbi:hypothetical protein BAE44_0016044 [Dichanthelium oligosanthes]|uniref:Uncharacterized protein n=1 Tax=Dichanthelium oligosanthes TaxID=888268 RepID=A0A1E5VCS3_9POAL|nr:hypothetical protein BAE44_0016044 [Dichanthelium oligosanthes]